MTTAPTVQPLHEFEAGNAPAWYWCRGHVSNPEFLRGLHQLGLVVSAYNVRRQVIRREWWRAVPTGADTGSSYVQARKGKRGAFAVTVVDAGNVEQSLFARLQGALNA
jgi:hypothetical protein